MESKKINQLATELAPDLSDLTIIGDPTTGISKKITLSQMASLFTGTVEEYTNFAAFPLVGVADTIYVAKDTNVIYRWDSTAYVVLSPNVIASLVFNDANGFDGTISLVGSVATLTITTALTTGSVGFIGASGALLQDNANFFWDDTNNRLGLGTNAPTTALDIFGSGIIGRINGTSTNNAYLGFASAGTNKWSVGNVQSDHRFRIFSEANSAELISVLQTGEFGIGIANPTTKIHIDGGASALIANLDANVSVAKSVSFRSDNSARINLEVSGTESGSNAGADFFLRTFTDAGSLIETPLSIVRSTGVTTIKSLTLTNALAATSGGTGQSSYAIGDILYASTTTALSKLADVAIGNALISGGVGVAPSWGKIALTTHVSGILPLANGGTGSATQNFVDLTSVQTAAGAKTLSAITTISNATTSSTTANGALVVAGGLGIGGDVNIGGTTIFGVSASGNSKFYIYGGFSAGLNLLQNYSGSAYTTEEHRASDYSFKIGTTSTFIITSAGDIGIGGVTSPVFKFDCAGVIYSSGSGAALAFKRRDATVYWYLYANGGNMFIENTASGVIGNFNQATGVYTATSDINKKKDFEESIIGLNSILGLKPTLYRMKDEDESSDKHLGFIAQEVKEFIPQAYNESNNGENTFIGLTEMPIIAALVKGMQEQQSQIEELKAEINLLKAK
jgi:hypothetical protein